MKTEIEASIKHLLEIVQGLQQSNPLAAMQFTQAVANLMGALYLKQVEG